jgi:hypothetical protein
MRLLLFRCVCEREGVSSGVCVCVRVCVSVNVCVFVCALLHQLRCVSIVCVCPSQVGGVSELVETESGVHIILRTA